jgi:hypothetical protein
MPLSVQSAHGRWLPHDKKPRYTQINFGWGRPQLALISRLPNSTTATSTKIKAVIKAFKIEARSLNNNSNLSYLFCWCFGHVLEVGS